MIVMRKSIIVLIVVFSGHGVIGQTQEATQLLLNYEKLKQLEEILDNMYKGYKILSQGYNRVKDIAEGNYSLHEVFLDGLFAVNPSVAKYQRIPDIIRYQSLLVKEYRRAFNRFKNDPNLTADEVRYLEKVYSYLVRQSLRNLEELTMIITANKLRMSDDERIQSIDRIYFDIENKLSFLRYFNNSTQVLVVQRTKESSEVGAMQKLYEVE
jgi:regulatory protein YycH of two-component signal transduction system YycFG